MKLIRYDHSMLDPVVSLADLRSEMDRLFDFAFPSFSRFNRNYNSSGNRCLIDLYRQGDKFIVRAEIPGVEKEDISLEIINGTLVLSGHCRCEKETKEDSSDSKTSTETQFSRSIALPAEVDVDHIKAQYENGILEVTLPQKEKMKPKQIRIETK